jgi:hypothetical protein
MWAPAVGGREEGKVEAERAAAGQMGRKGRKLGRTGKKEKEGEKEVGRRNKERERGLGVLFFFQTFKLNSFQTFKSLNSFKTFSTFKL